MNLSSIKKKKRMKSNLLALCLLALLSFNTNSHAEDLRRLVSLSGTWMFSIGDDMAWAAPDFDDSDWDRISVPDSWESQGYADYNGYAWYRKKFQTVSFPKNSQVILVLGRIDDADAVYLNGKLLGKNGIFPPYPETAYDRVRKYPIPDGMLNENGENVIAIRVYDSQLDGGIVHGPVGIFYDSDTEFLNLNLTGKWRIHEGDDKEWRNTDFNDSDWKRILVPSAWENTALSEYDGYAWYRVHFRVPENFPAKDLYLTLGKIDDVDDVYLNGKYVGSVYDLKRRHDWGEGWEYSIRRLYKIDGSLLKPGQLNTLAVRVYDGQGVGGIYEGPVGFMSESNYHRYKDKHRNEGSFWDFLFYRVFED